jgi:hypothetical protein
MAHPGAGVAHETCVAQRGLSREVAEYWPLLAEPFAEFAESGFDLAIEKQVLIVGHAMGRTTSAAKAFSPPPV